MAGLLVCGIGAYTDLIFVHPLVPNSWRLSVGLISVPLISDVSLPAVEWKSSLLKSEVVADNVSVKKVNHPTCINDCLASSPAFGFGHHLLAVRLQAFGPAARCTERVFSFVCHTEVSLPNCFRKSSLSKWWSSVGFHHIWISSLSPWHGSATLHSIGCQLIPMFISNNSSFYATRP